jgi:hypothetical protein
VEAEAAAPRLREHEGGIVREGEESANGAQRMREGEDQREGEEEEDSADGEQRMGGRGRERI